MKSQKSYQEYIPGRSLSTFFEKDKIPLLQMRHLRDLDFPITRSISYERTVDEFLLQLAVNDVLLPLRSRKELVVLLDAQGAMIRKNGQWSLLFTPDEEEMQTLAEDAPLYPVLKDMLNREKTGKVCRITVPERNMKTLVSDLSPFCILDEYCKNSKGGYMAEAEKIVIAGPDDLYRHVPVCSYQALATVDKDEVESFHTIRLLLEDYINRYDAAARGENIRPLSIAVFGPPGSGKSFGVKQIASSIGHFSLTSLNLSQYNEPLELFEGLNEALHSEEGEIPLIFMDEFDCELQGISRGWLKYYLAPMQDGEYTLNGRSYQIKGAVFVFAGGTASTFNGFLPSTPEEEETFRKVKGPDFVSRLEGILNIKGPNPVSVSDQSHLIRRAMLMRSQIVHKVSSIYDPESGLVNISRNMLSALLSVSEYRHGSRSLEFILDMSRLTEVSRFTPSCLPIDEQLDIHLDVTDFRKRLSYEQMMGDYEEKYAMAAHENYCRRRLDEAEKFQMDKDQVQALKAEPEMAPWEELDASCRREYFSQIHYIGVQLQDYESTLGLRPVLPGSSDTITELYGPVLEELSEMEHRRWMLDREKEGWRSGPYDPDAKTMPEMVPYDELDETSRENIRLIVRAIPENLLAIGFELYRKVV